MSNLVIIRAGPDLFTQVAVDSGDLRRVLNTRHSVMRNDDSYRIELYAAVEDVQLVGAISLVEFPDIPDTCVIDFLSVGSAASPGVRELLLTEALRSTTVIAFATVAPALIANEDFRKVGDLFVHTTEFITEEELIKICQTYQTRVSSLYASGD